MIGPHLAVLQAPDVILVSAHRLVTEYPQNRQVGVNNNTQPDAAEVVEVSTCPNVPEGCE